MHRSRTLHPFPAALEILLALPLAVLIAAPLPAQYFGRNKVQYEHLDFSVLTQGHFSIYHYPEGASAVLDAARMLEGWYAEHSRRFGFDIKGLQKVILYDSFVDFQQTNAVPGIISQGEGGVTESLGNRVVLYLTGVYAENSHVLGHELVHAFQYQRLISPGSAVSSGQPLPLWFVEGMAEYFSKGRSDPLTDMWMRDAVLNKDVPGIDELSSDPGRYFPYRFGQAVWEYVDKGWGENGTRSLFDESASRGVSAGIEAALGMKYSEFSKKWKDDLTASYTQELAGKSLPGDVGRMLPGIGNGLNLGPVISPDGKYIAVFSRRDLFTLDLFLADAASGKILKALASSDTDAHFDALQFIDSAGTWSADSRSFAFVVFQEGDAAIAIVDVPSGKLEKVIPFESIDGISNLAWSPDGSLIALSATSKAIRDLFLLDPQSGRLTKLTSGWHAELEPAWSPDGKTLVYATDRGAKTGLDSLTFHSMNLGFLDIATHEERIVSIKDGARHINPQFSPDGKSVYFVADPDGVADLYRYDLDARQFFRVTSVATGISGLTELSPCFSLARGSGELVFSVFNKREYEVHALSLEEAQGTPVSFEGEIPVAFLPDDTARAVEALKETPQPKIPAPSFSPYFPQFGLIAVSQASFGLALSPFGPSLGGAVELYLEDVLGDHSIDLAIQSSGTLDSFGGQAVYINRTGRVNWGLGIAHIPQDNFFLLPPAAFTITPADTGVVDQKIFTEEADFLAWLPLSINRRLEADLGYTFIWYEQKAPVSYYLGGGFAGQDNVSLAAPPPLSLPHASLAYVGDYSFFGFTAPIRGYRYRLEVDQTVGSLIYLTALADARLYLFLKPLTFAVRALHVGRYLGDADDPTLNGFYLGLHDLVRGYDYFSVTSIDSAGDPASPQVNRLFGSKIAVVNAEIRLPVLGTRELGLLSFPYLPTDLVAFLDGGVAWTNSEPPVLELSADQTLRVPVFSAGAALRLNILGVLVLEIYWAYPLQRPKLVGGEWGLLIAEGW